MTNSREKNTNTFADAFRALSKHHEGKPPVDDRPCKFTTFEEVTRCTHCAQEWGILSCDTPNQAPRDFICGRLGREAAFGTSTLAATVATTTREANGERFGRAKCSSATTLIVSGSVLLVLGAWLLGACYGTN